MVISMLTIGDTDDLTDIRETLAESWTQGGSTLSTTDKNRLVVQTCQTLLHNADSARRHTDGNHGQTSDSSFSPRRIEEYKRRIRALMDAASEEIRWSPDGDSRIESIVAQRHERRRRSLDEERERIRTDTRRRSMDSNVPPSAAPHHNDVCVSIDYHAHGRTLTNVTEGEYIGD